MHTASRAGYTTHEQRNHSGGGGGDGSIHMSIGDDGVFSLLDPKYIWGKGSKNGTGFFNKRAVHACAGLHQKRERVGHGTKGVAFSTGDGGGGEERANQNWAFL